MGTQEDFTNAKEEAIDEEKAGQEAEAGLDQWQDYIPTLLYWVTAVVVKKDENKAENYRLCLWRRAVWRAHPDGL